MKSTGYLPAQLVRSELERHLHDAYNSQSAVEIEATGRIRNTRWSSIHFCTVQRKGRTDHYVVKIPRVPGQESPEDSWQSAELLERGWLEYNSIVRIYNHFTAQDDTALQALRPEAYLSRINAVVMNFIPSGTLYDNTIKLPHLLSAAGRQQALRRLNTTGRWLGWLHNLPIDNVDPAQVSGISVGLATLLTYAEQLSAYPDGPHMIPGWASALDLLHQASSARHVWIHGDFHMGNILVMPNSAILSLDTVHSIVDDPCADIGKLMVDLHTRRERLLSQGMLPSNVFVRQLITAFLKGYETQAAPVNPLTLALYEGLYLLEKWLQCREAADEQFTPTFRQMVAPLINQNINHVLGRMVKNWVARVHRLAA